VTVRISNTGVLLDGSVRQMREVAGCVACHNTGLKMREEENVSQVMPFQPGDQPPQHWLDTVIIMLGVLTVLAAIGWAVSTLLLLLQG